MLASLSKYSIRNKHKIAKDRHTFLLLHLKSLVSNNQRFFIENSVTHFHQLKWSVLYGKVCRLCLLLILILDGGGGGLSYIAIRICPDQGLLFQLKFLNWVEEFGLKFLKRFLNRFLPSRCLNSGILHKQFLVKWVNIW